MDERIERIRAYLHHPGLSTEVLVLDLDSIEADLAELDAYKRRGFLLPENPCPECGGVGRKTYPNTSTWRLGIGGQALTEDVCNRCWGSGATDKTGTNLFELYAELTAVKAQLKTVTHERAVALRAVEVMYRQFDADTDCFEKCVEDYKKWKGCNCIRAALAMAEKELAK